MPHNLWSSDEVGLGVFVRPKESLMKDKRLPVKTSRENKMIRADKRPIKATNVSTSLNFFYRNFEAGERSD